MVIDSMGANTGVFLADLNATQSRMVTLNDEITSGYRVSQASDDPAAVQPILSTQAEIARVTQVQTNLTGVQTEVQGADSALQTATNLLDSALTLADQGASTTASATSMTSGAQQVQQILQQMVGLANTTVNGRYVFGGDASSTAPYAYDASAPNGVQQLSSASSTRVVEDASGNQLNPLPTAQDVFDASGSSVFAALSSLETALSSGSSTAVQSTVAAIQAAQTQVSGQLTSIGNAETWLQSGVNNASSMLSSLQQQLGSLRDTDMPTAISDLTLAQTSETAALSAEGQMSQSSLFSYLG